ncbi:spermidine/putrescine ABC transporter ATP-binding protein [Bacillus cereus]|nr:spermidine/putrescine ABC transporter ATP-binding protein [Bacillus cereus]
MYIRRCHVFYPALTGSKTPPPQNSEKAKKLGGG